jgi:hypothetical protein
MTERFIATFDLHFGWERKGGHKVPLHDPKAWAAVMAFAADFKPTTWIHGGDMLDCGVISHHRKGKPGQTEGLRLLADATEGRKLFIDPVEKVVGKGGKLVYIVGNHEDWLTDLTDEMPSLEGIVNIENLLGLDRWTVIPQGGMYRLGKLCFVHGDTIKGGEMVAKAAVINYEESIRFGHHHTAQLYTKTSPIQSKLAKTGMAVPCLCSKDPKYGEGAPNRWVQGFLYGYVGKGGIYNDYLAIIIDGKVTINGKSYG